MKHTFAQKLLKQGIAASKAGQRDDAHRLLRQAIELDPDNETAWLWLSGLVDSVSERQQCLKQVLRLNPNNTHARAGLAWLEQQASQTAHPEIKPITRPSIEVQPERVLPPEHLCPFCKNSVSAHSTNCPHCHRALVVACPNCETQMDIEEPNCRRCGYQFEDYQRGAAYYAALGDAYLANLKGDLAVTAWQQVVEMDADYADAYLRLGEAQTVAGDWEGARANFERAARQTTNPVDVYLAIGSLYERRHQWDEARKVYEQVLAMDESSVAAQFALGRLLMEGQALQAAFPHIRRVTELNPKHARAWYSLGQLYEMAQERRKAIRAYEHVTGLAESESPDTEWHKRAAERLEWLRPSLPPNVALNWPETIRQTASRALIPAVAALVNGGLRPWQIAPIDYLGVLLAVLGAYFWVSASATPRNPGMRAMLGQNGLSNSLWQAILGLLGGLFWATGLLYILISPALTGGFTLE